jgi:hypothetical protein
MNVMDENHNNDPNYQEDTVLGNRRPMVAAFVGQSTGCAEYFDNGDNTKEEKNNPDNLVAFEDIFD